MDEKYRCTIENFIMNTEPEYSICREERQYTVFLYNILRYYWTPEIRKFNERAKRIFTACRIPKEAVVKQVFYEATFMRDFFERNRRYVLSGYNADKLLDKKFSPSDYRIEKSKNSFNYKLMEYLLGEPGAMDSIEYLDVEKNLGSNKNTMQTRLSDSPKKNQVYKSTIRQMMNAKPDIAVLYGIDEKQYLLLLECKFESNEASYSNGDSQDKKEKMSQSKIQWKIADFLCNHYLKGKAEINVSDSMKDGRSCLVRFVRKWEAGKQTGKEIWIRDLIDLNREEIFHEQ